MWLTQIYPVIYTPASCARYLFYPPGLQRLLPPFFYGEQKTKYDLRSTGYEVPPGTMYEPENKYDLTGTMYEPRNNQTIKLFKHSN
jgi:hypothetical protein